MPKMIDRDCLRCETPFKASTKDIRNGYGKFCSLSCSSKYHGELRKKERIPNRVCATCGEYFYRNPKNVSRTGYYFCCKSHYDIAKRIGGIRAVQPKHYGTSLSSYRLKTFRTKPMKCEQCGYDKYPQALDVHHEDGDRTNNDMENLKILCLNCHAERHILEGTFKKAKIAS